MEWEGEGVVEWEGGEVVEWEGRAVVEWEGGKVWRQGMSGRSGGKQHKLPHRKADEVLLYQDGALSLQTRHSTSTARL